MEVLYGRNPVREALSGRRRVSQVWVAEDNRPQPWLPPDARRAAREELTRLCGTDEHQGVCAQVDAYPYVDARHLLSAEDALVICLDQVQDPQNLGAVCRVAEAAGASGVVIPERRAAQVSPAVVRASAGAVEHLRVARVGNVADWLLAAKDREAWVYGAAAGAETPYTEPDYGGRVVLVLGSEGRGLRPRVASACDRLVALPLRGRVASLNVATAAAALVYGILQKRAGLDRTP